MTKPLPLLHVQEAAAVLGVCRKTLSNWIRKGLISKIPGTSYISRAELERFLEAPRPPERGKRGRYNLKGKKGERK